MRSVLLGYDVKDAQGSNNHSLRRRKACEQPHIESSVIRSCVEMSREIRCTTVCYVCDLHRASFESWFEREVHKTRGIRMRNGCNYLVECPE